MVGASGPPPCIGSRCPDVARRTTHTARSAACNGCHRAFNPLQRSKQRVDPGRSFPLIETIDELRDLSDFVQDSTGSATCVALACRRRSIHRARGNGDNPNNTWTQSADPAMAGRASFGLNKSPQRHACQPARPAARSSFGIRHWPWPVAQEATNADQSPNRSSAAR